MALYTQAERASFLGCKGDIKAIEAAQQAGKISLTALISLLAEARSNEGDITMQDSGTVRLPGINMPWGVSLYPSQWQIVKDRIDEILTVCEANADELKRRGDISKAAKKAAKESAKAAKIAPATAPAPEAPAASTQPA